MSRAQNAMRLIKHERTDATTFLHFLWREFHSWSCSGSLRSREEARNLGSWQHSSARSLKDLIRVDWHAPHSLRIFLSGTKCHITRRNEKKNTYSESREQNWFPPTLYCLPSVLYCFQTFQSFLLFLNSLAVYACSLSPFWEFVTHSERILTRKLASGRRQRFMIR